MSSLLAIDSGHPECACAWADDGRLCAIGSFSLAVEVASDMPGFGSRRFSRVVVEVPQSDGRSVPLDDLIRVATTGVRLAERLAGGNPVHEYRPREWKGSVPKPPHHARMWDVLTPAERELLGGARTHAAIVSACARGAAGAWKKPGATYYRDSEFPTVNGTKITHDILDAAALALYDLKRIRKG